MRKFDIKESAQKGSMMIEALALLGLITMVTPILYKKAAERTTELQDINVATQMRMISSAVDDYIKDNYKQMGDDHPAGTFKIDTEDELNALRDYLPPGFNLADSKLFESYDISVNKREVTDLKGTTHSVFTSAVMAPLKNSMTIMRSAKIASMIGANGGVYREAGDNSKIEGVQGTWEATLADYDFDEDVLDGSLVVISAEAINSSKGDVASDEVLYRVPSDQDKNTMRTTLYMDGNDVRDVAALVGAGDEIGGEKSVMIGKPGSDISSLLVTGAAQIEDMLTVTGGGADITGVLRQSGGEIDLHSNGAATIQSDGTMGLTSGDAMSLESTGGTMDLTSQGAMNLASIEGGMNLTSKDAMALSSSEGAVSVTGQAGATISSSAGDVTIKTENLANKIDISSANQVNVSGKNVQIAGTENASIKAGEYGFSTSEGAQTPASADVTDDIYNTISGNTQIDGNLHITGTLSADYLHAKQQLTAGADNNFLATNDTVHIGNRNFAVGGEVGTVGNAINVDENGVFVGSNYQTDGNHEGLLVKTGELVLRNSLGKLEMANDQLLLGNNKARIVMKDESAFIGVGEDGNEATKVIADSEKAGFENKADGQVSSIYLQNNKFKFNADSKTALMVDNLGMAIGSDITASNTLNMDDPDAYPGISDKLITAKDGRNVVISRNGILEVRSPEGSTDTGGFIRARRIVSDVKYPEHDAFHGATAAGEGLQTKERYDYYQVNPAYTSVMNDIKLASRGGARLSDILPDFITKEIYVVDNTYDESKMTQSWFVGSLGNDNLKDSTECTDANCIASPWLGFVPAPQCPPHYAQAVTIAPIRWRMAEVYYVNQEANGGLAKKWADGTGKTYPPSNYKEIITTNTFNDYFYIQPNPLHAVYQIDSTRVDELGQEHTHGLKEGYPLTFQTNTFLNTTLALVWKNNVETKGNPENFRGWHTAMGFLYYKTDYEALLSDLGETSYDVYWNVFPVYGSDMAGVVNTYCYFDRDPLPNREWVWGSTGPVYQYDQLNGTTRYGFEKTEAWDAAVNDPSLGYKDAW